MKRLVIIAAILSIASSLYIIGYQILNYTRNNEEVAIKVEPGINLRQVAEQLQKQDIIVSDDFFIVYTKIMGSEKSIKTGEFIIPPRTKFNVLLDILQKPRNEHVKVTIPEGYTLHQIAKRLEEKNLVDSDIFINISEKNQNKMSVSRQNNEVYYNFEGFLYPDTYLIPTYFDEVDIINIMTERFKHIFSDEYTRRADRLGFTVNELITIASLIEKEAANDEERKKIAGVIYNRLQKNMLLQIDATVIYGITKGQYHISRVTYDHLKSVTQYNTYQNKGLPPGPIGAPGKASIEAALYPEDHEYLYYVFSGDGHVFSRTYEEHLENVRKYIR